MRGTTTRFASIESQNQLQFNFPYNGGSTGRLTLRDKSGDLNVMLSIDKGQFTCNPFSNNTVAVKFDSGSILRFRCTGTSDGTSNVIFLESEHRFLNGLKRSQHAIIEAEFFQAGPQQFKFNTAGLKW